MDTQQVQDNNNLERTFYVPIGANLTRSAGPIDSRGFIALGGAAGSTGRKRSIKMLDESEVAY